MDLGKLTVPQLKALCKERRISGYSKLGKTALIQTLSEVIASRPVLSPLSLGNIASDTLIEAEKQNAKQAKAISPQSNLRGKGDSSLSVILDLGSENSSNPGTHLPGPPASSVASSPGAFAQAVRVVSPPAITQSSKSIAPSEQPLVLSVESPRILSRPTSSTPPAAEPNTEPPNCDEPASKRLKLTHIPTSNPTQLDKPPPSMRIPTTGTSTYASSSPTSKRPSEGATRSTCRAIPNVTSKLLPMHSSTGKRFRPLVLDKARLLQSVSQPSSSQASPSMPFRRGEFTLQYLDFPSGMFNTSVFKPITMPPSLSQRSRVRAWAIILSGLSNQERKQCTKVSRMIRYAVYLSASHILEQQFSGKRLQRATENKNQAMINMWPYLRTREQEVAERRGIYQKSFLIDLFIGSSPISSALWSSPDHDLQLTIALRFAITRLWFSVSVDGQNNFDWLKGVIQDAQEVVPGEIWRVSIQKSDGSRPEAIYVLEATCEVVGYSSDDLSSIQEEKTTVMGNARALRADWTTYIQQQVSNHRQGNAVQSLLSHLKWANYEEYNRGISKLWLTRIASESLLGLAKKVVAERYVLACVVDNSISGKWMSAVQMAQEFAGMPSRTDSTNLKTKEANLGLFLPGHHHVESVHFLTSAGRPLHPALASVQTLHREYIVLRDNGMEVGCEEDGVSVPWMNLLKCDSKGLAL